jgi:hypothetical protein
MDQCCQILQTKNQNLGKFVKVLQWKMSVFFSTSLSILRPNAVFCGHSVHFEVIWYIFPVLVCCTEKNLATLEWMAHHPTFVRLQRRIVFKMRSFIYSSQDFYDSKIYHAHCCRSDEKYTAAADDANKQSKKTRIARYLTVQLTKVGGGLYQNGGKYTKWP